MYNYWLTKIKVTSVTGTWSSDCHGEYTAPFSEPISSDRNKLKSLSYFRCRVEGGMLNSCRQAVCGRVLSDMSLNEKEWEVVERFAGEVFFKAGLLKEKPWDID